MNITLNSLPAKTWNHLKMNQSQISLEGDFEKYTPEAEAGDSHLLWNPCSSWQRLPESYGFNRDFSQLTEGADTALLEASEGQQEDSPFVLRFRYGKDDRKISRLVLHGAEGSRMSVIITMESEDESADISALQIEAVAEENAEISIYMAQLTGKNSICLNEIGGTCAADSKVTLTRLELGASKAFTGASLDLAGRNSQFISEMGYYAKAGQRIDINLVALHHGQGTNSLMEAYGTMEENSSKIFRGTIDFQQGCKGATGTENENVLLLGEDMVNQTIPLILCKEEDVEGNHGASIGQLDEKLLFYLGSRGIAADEAQQMIAKARIQSICDKIPSEEIRETVGKFHNREVS